MNPNMTLAQLAPVAECERRGGQTPNQPEHSDRMLENQLQKVNEDFRKDTEQP